MSNWSKITLYKFQQISEYSNREDLSEEDKALFCTCVMFGLTEYQLDNMNVKKAMKLIGLLQKTFELELKTKPANRVGLLKLNYDIGSMRFGQYVELSFYLQARNAEDFKKVSIANAHKILASISNYLFMANNSASHSRKADYFLRRPVTGIIGSISLLIEKFNEFNGRFKALFGSAEHEEDAVSDPFNRRYGWTYSAATIAEYERIPLQQVYDLPVVHAFNDLHYLKEKAAYEYKQLKKK